MVKFSVIIPTYNRGLYISEAIKSVMQQSCDDFELIIIDDGSTDNTKDIVSSFNSSKILYFHQKNAGVSVARNRGIFMSSGEYVAFLDSDDMWRKDKLEKQAYILDSDRKIGMVYTDWCLFNRSGQNKNSFLCKMQPPSGKIFKAMITANYISTPTVVVRRSILPNSGIFDPTLSMAEDYDLWLRLAYCTECYYIPDVLVYIREHEGRTVRCPEKCIINCLVREMQMHRWSFMPGVASAFAEQAAIFYLSCAYDCRIRGDFINANYCYSKALRYTPKFHKKIRLIACNIYVVVRNIMDRFLEKFRNENMI